MQTGWVAVTPQKQTVNLEATGTCGVVTFKNRQSSGGMILPPTGAGCSGTHVVQPGNTLFSIARWYGSSVSAIKQANRLWSDTIWVGQKLCIP
ncbi:MAG: LysM peptidoglycan-binding domain-containing protein [Anaerolineae bacterium]|nr:LysM peptidoglycan-binding domain-containing protein [Anaerolineae bacterium]